MAKDLLIISEAIEKFLDERKYTTLRDVLKTMQAADIAALFEILPRRKLSLLFRLLPKEQAAEAFVEMDLDLQEHLIHGFSDNELKEIVDELYLDDTVDMVEELPANVVKRILAQANPETRQLINEMLQYPEDSAGSVMTTEYVDLSADMTVPDAIKHIKRTGVDKETINVCYVTSSDRKLIGEVPIRSLILAEDKQTVGEIMQKNVISVTTQEDQEEVAQTFAKYDCIALPVVDSEGRLVGIVTVDDAIDILQSEATEDIDKMAAVTPSDRPYLKLSTFAIYKSRIPWLLILMISATFTGSIITHYESALSSYLVLTASIPMLMDTGGNCGSQASATIIRGISLQQIKFSDIFRVVWKETRVALLCGLTLAAVNFVKLIFLSKVTVTVAAVICLTLVFTVFVAKIVGCTLPILAKRVGGDPAVMASPFLTTIVDALSLVIYFEIAGVLLHI
ncbi:MAG: magnesium transporter [Oscillospiraceae bacterium]|nr:magnesium transporter [Oscillospiraceae bacterium]